MIVAEILDGEGQALSRVELDTTCTIGTDRGCGLVLADPTVEPHHLELREGPSGTVVLRRLGEGGETRIGSLVLGSEAEVTLPATVSVGAVTLRLSGGAESPTTGARESKGVSSGAARAWTLCLGATLLITAQELFTTYKAHPWHQALATVIGVLILVPLWAGSWTIGNRLFGYRGRFHPHLSAFSGWVLVALPAGVAMTAATAILHTDAMRILEVGVNLLLIAWMLYRHIGVASRWRPPTNATIASAIVLAFGGLALLGIDTAAEKPVNGALTALEPLPAALYVTRSPDELVAHEDAILRDLEDMTAKRSVEEGP